MNGSNFEILMSEKEKREHEELIRQQLSESGEHAARVRGPVLLNPLKKSAQEFDFWTLDFECEGWDGRVRRQVSFSDGKEVWQTPIERRADRTVLQTLKEGKYAGEPIYVHNLSYDGLFLMEGASALGMDKKPFHRNRLMALRITLDEGDVSKGLKPKVAEFRDSFSLTFTSLAKLTKEFGVAHPKLEAVDAGNAPCAVHGKSCDYNRFFNPAYQRNDVLGLHEALDKMFVILSHDVSLTLASTSMRHFRRHYLDHSIRRNNKYVQGQRLSYYGARTEVGAFNDERDKDFWYYDVNSLYPWAMRELQVPVGAMRAVDANIEVEGMTYAIVKEEGNAWPTLPVRGGKLFFYNGAKSGWWVNAELCEAVRRGAKVQAIRTIASDENEAIFSRFVTDTYARRMQAKQEGNGSLAFVLKLVMNSLYGKFGQKAEAEDYFFDQRSIPLDALPLNDSHTAWKKTREQDSQHIIPIIAAMITAKARLRLLEEIDRQPSDSIFYLDTDSLILDRPGINAGPELGKFKLEGKIHSFFPFGPKIYSYEDEDGHSSLKVKGMSAHEGDEEVTFKEKLDSMIQFVSGNAVENRSGILNLVSALKKTDGFTFAFSKSMTRSFAGLYDKRRVLPDGSTDAFTHDRMVPPKEFANPGYAPVLERVRRNFVRTYG